MLSETVVVAIIGGSVNLAVAVLTFLNRLAMKNNHAENKAGLAKISAASTTIGDYLEAIARAERAKGDAGERAAPTADGTPVFWTDAKGGRHQTTYRPPDQDGR